MLDVVSSAWTNRIPGGIITLSTITIGIGVILFSNLEGISYSDAIYATFIIGTLLVVIAIVVHENPPNMFAANSVGTISPRHIRNHDRVRF